MSSHRAPLETAAAICPTCKIALPDTGAFPAWCPSCNWNLETETSFIEWKPTALDKLINKVRGKYAKRQFEEMAARDPALLKHRWTAAKLATYALAALVNLFPILLLAGGIWLIAANWPAIWAFVWGGILIFAAFAFRPRRNKMPKNLLGRADGPRLHAFVDRVAVANGAPRPHGLVVEASFNAAFLQLSLPRRTIVVIGLPLWSILSPQERVALLSHEFAHGMNGDSLAHGFIANAIHTLLRLAAVFQPDSGEFFAMMLTPFYIAVSEAFRWLAYLMIVLFWQRSQEAEFLADHNASKVAGSDAAQSLLRKIALGSYLRSVLDPIAYSADWQRHNFFPAFRAFVGKLPALELERARRIYAREDFSEEMTHPPRWARIKFMEQHPSPPSLLADETEMAAIDRELETLERPLTGSLLNAYYPQH